MEKFSHGMSSPRKTYECHICHRSFIRLHRLQSHIRTHSGKKFNIVDPKYSKMTPAEEASRLIRNAISGFTNASQNGGQNKTSEDETLPSTPVEETDTSNFQENVVVEEMPSEIDYNENSTDSEGLSVSMPVEVLIADQNTEYEELRFPEVENIVTVETEVISVSDEPKPKVYTCGFCMKTFKNKCHFGRHILTHTKEKPHVCKTCGQAFAQIGNLSVHMRVHEKPKISNNCPDRDPKIYPFHIPKITLVTKKREEHRCEICAKNFKNKCYLERHVLTHSNEKPHVCTICNKGFTQLGNLNVHLKTHSSEKTSICYICGKAFVHHSALKVHMLTHSENKPYKCTVCEKGFTNVSFLRRHALIHLELKPHTCKVCGKGFAQVGNLNVHLQIHNKPKLFQCDGCRVNFVSKACFEKHIMLHVMEEILTEVVVLTECSAETASDIVTTETSDSRPVILFTPVQTGAGMIATETTNESSTECCPDLQSDSGIVTTETSDSGPVILFLPVQTSSGMIATETTNESSDSGALIKKPRFSAKARKSIRTHQPTNSIAIPKKQLECSNVKSSQLVSRIIQSNSKPTNIENRKKSSILTLHDVSPRHCTSVRLIHS